MTSDTPISELDLVVLACATLPVQQEEMLQRVLVRWTSPAPAPTSGSLFGAVMSMREQGLLESMTPEVFQTTARGHRLLQRALCGALGAPRPAQRPGNLTFPQAMAIARLLPVPTLVTVLRTRLDALDREKVALADQLRAAHARGETELHIASLNFREGLLNAERAFLITFVGDVEDGFVALGGQQFAPSPLVLPVT